MSGAAGAALSGALILRPGPGRTAIASSRVPLAGALLRGRPAGEAMLMLPRLFALCGQAHRVTAALAVATAMAGDDRRAGQAGVAALAPERAALAAETLREHVRRLLIDWPRLLGQPADGAAAALRACPLFGAAAMAHNGGDGAAARDWIGRELLGGPVAPWLAGWREDRAGWLGRWSGRAQALPARLMRAVRDDAVAIGAAWPPLRAQAGEAGMRALAARMADGAGLEYVAGDTGAACETGCWTRLGGGGDGDQAAPDSAWLRMGARLAEVCRLAGDGPAAGRAGWADGGALACGALWLGEGEALAWTEMARGVLCHRVRLELDGARPTIGDYHVLAPTDWNFHPRGVVADALAALPAGGDAVARAATARRVGVLAAAFDPCVHFEIEFAHA